MSIKLARVNRGFTLIEMIVAIVIISIGVAGVLAAFMVNVRGSADAVVNKQLLAIAEEMLEEIELKPYAVNGTAPGNASVNCGATAARSGFDDVRDYNGYQTTGICDIDGNAVAGLEGYNVAVSVQMAVLGGIANALRITVTATRGLDTITLDGFRTQH